VAWGRALDGEDVPAQRAVLDRLVEGVAPARVQHARYRAHVRWTPPGRALHEWALRTAGEPPLPQHPKVLFFRAAAGAGGPEGGRPALTATTRRYRTRNLDQLRRLPEAAFAALPERDRALVALYCGRTDGEPHRWTELAARFGVSPGSVGPILRRSVTRLLGPAAVPRGITAVVCAVCGASFPMTTSEARAAADHACGPACRAALLRRLQRARARPLAGAVLALPPAAFARLTERQRALVTRYYGAAGHPEHTLQELATAYRAAPGTVLRELDRALTGLLGPAAAAARGLGRAVVPCGSCGAPVVVTPARARLGPAPGCSAPCAWAMQRRAVRAAAARRRRPRRERLLALPPEAFDALPEPDRRLVRRYYGLGEAGSPADGETLAELAAACGLTPSRARATVARAVGRLLGGGADRAAGGGPGVRRRPSRASAVPAAGAAVRPA
jgi:hypothetical protein